MIEDGVHIRREDALIGVVHLHSGIGPPKERLRQGCTIADTPLYLQIGTARTQREASSTLLMEHPLHLVYPNGD